MTRPQPNGDAAGVMLRVAWCALGFLALAQCALLLVIFANHFSAPDITRGTEPVRRLLSGLPLYAPPSAEYIPAAYNPLLPVLGAGLAAIFGLTPRTLPTIAMAGSLVALAMVFIAVRRETASAWFGVVAAGLFASGLRAFDCYLSYPHADSWMLCTGLLGLYLLQLNRSRLVDVLAIVVLCLSFWFKQQGALLALAGVLYVTWRHGWRESIACWIAAGLCGPLAYVAGGPWLFGGTFLYYTYQVPSAWSEFSWRYTVGRPAKYFLLHWAVLGGASIAATVSAAVRRQQPNVWIFSLPFALLIGLLGSLDESENNVYIVPSVWLILIGTIALANRLQREHARAPAAQRRGALVAAAIALSFALNLYDPRTVLVPAEAWDDYRSLASVVRNLDGVIFMPWIAQLSDDARPSIAVGWVPLEDLVRGPGRTVENHPLVRSILRQLLEPAANAYLLMDQPLEDDALLRLLGSKYVLVRDFGNQYRSLRARPGRYSGAFWPRYLYAYRGNLPPPTMRADNAAS